MVHGSHSDGDPVWLAGPPVPPALLGVLSESRDRGLIGSTDLDNQVIHARGFASNIPPGARVLDLGSGGGLPGLVVAAGRPDVELLLLDSAARRIRFLRWAVEDLDVGGRAGVLHARAEDAGRLPELRGQFDVVVSRSFGPPAVTAECARPFLRDGGLLIVSEPPPGESRNGSGRWPERGLAELALELEAEPSDEGGNFALIRARGECGTRFPRRAGVPDKRPLF